MISKFSGFFKALCGNPPSENHSYNQATQSCNITMHIPCCKKISWYDHGLLKQKNSLANNTSPKPFFGCFFSKLSICLSQLEDKILDLNGISTLWTLRDRVQTPVIHDNQVIPQCTVPKNTPKVGATGHWRLVFWRKNMSSCSKVSIANSRDVHRCTPWQR